MKLTKMLGKKQNKVFNIVLILGVVVVVGLLLRYSRSKGIKLDAMSKNSFSNVGKVETSVGQTEGATAEAKTSGASPVDTTDGPQFLSVSGMSSGSKVNNSCNNQQLADPKELLPSDSNNEWSNIMPNKDLKNVQMLSAGHHIGVNSVGSSLRNANLQLRSEPVIPQSNIGPWNNTTIEPDNLRRPMEIGTSE
tara:strand:- start:444 stop:1022 length:579 start_codon:yes stop_codon:yes gene_type:complete